MNYVFKVIKAFREGGVSLIFKRAAQTLFPDRYGDFINIPRRGLPVVVMQAEAFEVGDKDVVLARRILDAFNKAKRTAQKDDLWSKIEGEYHKEFFEVMAADDARKVAKFFANAHTHGITYGISDGSSAEYDAVKNDAKVRQFKGAVIKDCLTAFANVFGENATIYADENRLLKAVSEHIGMDIVPPPRVEGGLFKLVTQYGRFDCRDIWGLYVAYRLSRLFKPKDTIHEIGGGLGKMALYAQRYGFNDYAIYDLPQINAVSAWYLAKSGMAVCLFGEEGEGIRIRPFWAFGEKPCAVVLNVDSFPEMGQEIVAGYIETTKKTSRFLYSVNQESQSSYGHKSHVSVPVIVAASGGFKNILRQAFAVRKHYYEELYEVA